mmetsp:Transcript_33448/g.54252  ORF Transcript_33448/g.54252 Transcript_33448/m.54252 type:complete len:89 (-) Transcript_33448:1668-1934(-)
MLQVPTIKKQRLRKANPVQRPFLNADLLMFPNNIRNTKDNAATENPNHPHLLPSMDKPPNNPVTTKISAHPITAKVVSVEARPSKDKA